MTLRAIVIGTGWAGEGHTLGLRAAGVDVVALCGRTPGPSQQLAERLEIPAFRLDWRSALDEFQPDIVAIATPAAPHHAMALAAAHAGCHVVCEKPLAVSAAEARDMLAAVERGGVKHAYAATWCYAPPFAHLRSLLADGVIGLLGEIDYLHCLQLPPLFPHGWVHQLAQGGGVLNNLFTHHLQQVLVLTGGTVEAAMGSVTRQLDRAPIGAPVHDFRQAFATLPTAEQAATAQWGPVDVDGGYALQLQLRLPDGRLVPARFAKPEAAAYPHPMYIAVHGSAGTLYLTEASGRWTLQHFDAAQQDWTTLDLPAVDTAVEEPVANPVQQQWNAFFAAFVADVRGEVAAAYPTFHDGWVAAEVIEIVRGGHSWTPVPERVGDGAGPSERG